jgi:ferrochelatase
MAYLLVNFGGPRNLDEVEPFLIELLCDKEVIRTPFPLFMHRFIFQRVAKKRAVRVREDYDLIGGKSPIFEDTENLAEQVGLSLKERVYTFHRYLPATHSAFINEISSIKEEIQVVPLFPQFSFATTGSIMVWFSKHLPASVCKRMRWTKSYPTHPCYIQAMQNRLSSFLREKNLLEEEVMLLFSAHGLPEQFDQTGDPYRRECESSYMAIKERFPKALSFLSYQSQFGNKPWIQPYTSFVASHIDQYTRGRKKVVMIPLSFTSDHIETLFEIENLYLPSIRERGLEGYRCPALNLDEEWVRAVASFFEKGNRPVV